MSTSPSRKELVKLRIGNYKLLIETGRYEQIPRDNRLCPTCKSNASVAETICHSSPIQNFEIVHIDHNTHTAVANVNVRCTVTILLYRKWRVKARRQSMQTPLRVKEDTPTVIQPHKNRTILKLQYALKFSLSSAILKATKDGWPTIPTRKSETAKAKQQCERWRMEFSRFPNDEHYGSVSQQK